MSPVDIPLLITATFDAGKAPYVALSGIEERVEKHMQGLLAWLKDGSFRKIVFVKNCTTQTRSDVLEKTASRYGAELEYITVKSSHRTQLQGKGFGEGDLIRQAIEQSEILRDSDEFFKITGKLYSPDVSRLFFGHSNGEFLMSSYAEKNGNGWMRELVSPLYRREIGSGFMGWMRFYGHIPWGMIASSPRGSIDTRLYRVRRDYYKEKLLFSYRRVQDSLGYSLENVVFDDVFGDKTIRLIKELPVILGTSGTLGTTAGSYTEEIQEQAKQLTIDLMTL